MSVVSVVSLENGSVYMYIDCEVGLFELKANTSVSVMSFKNPYEILIEYFIAQEIFQDYECCESQES